MQYLVVLQSLVTFQFGSTSELPLHKTQFVGMKHDDARSKAWTRPVVVS